MTFPRLRPLSFTGDDAATLPADTGAEVFDPVLRIIRAWCLDEAGWYVSLAPELAPVWTLRRIHGHGCSIELTLRVSFDFQNTDGLGLRWEASLRTQCQPPRTADDPTTPADIAAALRHFARDLVLPSLIIERVQELPGFDHDTYKVACEKWRAALLPLFEAHARADAS